jgi:hypothetical protein
MGEGTGSIMKIEIPHTESRQHEPIPMPPLMMAHCDMPGHVLVRLGGDTQHGMSALTAVRLMRDLRNAVEHAAGWPVVL